MKNGIQRTPNLLQRLVTWAAAFRLPSTILAKILPRLDSISEKILGQWRTATSLLTGLPVIRLITMGVKSKRPHATYLLGFPRERGYVVVASSFGSRSHPDWYHNLLVNPLLEVETPVGRGKCRARLLQGEEYDFWWERITTYYPGYLRYQQWAGPRKVPLISLEPLPGREDT